MAFENYTIKQFMDAWFKDDYSEMSKDEFDLCYSEYVDTTGLFATEMFDKVTYIHFLNNRINSVNLEIKLQKDFLKEFGVPYKEHFEWFLNSFGYDLSWTDEQSFLKMLDRVEIEDKQYTAELERNIKELKELKRQQDKGEEPTKKQSRESFIRTVNSLGKIGYKIDNWKTTVEELSLMIKQQMEENKNV